MFQDLLHQLSPPHPRLLLPSMLGCYRVQCRTLAVACRSPHLYFSYGKGDSSFQFLACSRGISTDFAAIYMHALITEMRFDDFPPHVDSAHVRTGCTVFRVTIHMFSSPHMCTPVDASVFFFAKNDEYPAFSAQVCARDLFYCQAELHRLMSNK